MRHNSIFSNRFFPLFFVLVFLSVFSDGAFSQSGKGKADKVKKTIEAKKIETEPGEKTIEKKEDGKSKKQGIIASEDEVEEEFSYTGMIIQTILILVMFVGGFYYFFRFVTKKAGIQIMGGETIQVLSVVPLGQSKFIQIIDLAGKILVIGVADSSINLITEITGRDEIDRIRLLSSKSTSVAKGSFKEYISKHLENIKGRFNSTKSRKNNKDVESTYTDTQFDVNYLKRQKDRLKKLNGFDNE